MPTEVVTPPVVAPPVTPPVETPPVPAAIVPPVVPPVTPPPVAPEGHVPHVPESYTLTLPEKSPLSGADLDRFRGEVKALGLTQDQAQKYVEAQNTATVAAIAQLQQEHEALKADPEIGGAKFDQSLAQAKRGMQELFGSDFEQATAFIDRLGLGNNLLLVRAFARFGAKFKEDRHVSGSSAGSPTQKTAAERMYPTMPAA